MSVRTWPGYAIAAFRWHKANQSSVFKSMFGSQSLEASTPLWEVSMSGVSEARAAARQIEAFIDSLNGFTDQIEIWNVEHPAPTGTMRGTMTLAAPAAQGATSLQLVTSYGTNLLTFPEAFDNAAWSPTGATVTPNTTVAPDGTTTADTLTLGTSGSDRFEQIAPIVAVAGNTYTFSCWVYNPTGTGSPNISLTTTTGVGGAQEVPIPANAGLTRYSTTVTYAAGVTGNVRAMIINRNSTAGATLIVWGAKLEAGALTDYGFGKTLLTGDLLGLGSGLTQQVVPVSADAISTGQGNITVSVGIPLRNAFSGGAAVTWDKPKALFRQKTLFDGMQYKPDGADVWSLSLREDWRP